MAMMILRIGRAGFGDLKKDYTFYKKDLPSLQRRGIIHA
jgi:hypothetical protein